MNKRKIKKFLSSKGGIAVIISTVSLCVIALTAMTFGYVYSDLNGDWSRLGELFFADWMIGIYVIMGLLVFLLIYALVLLNRKEENY